MKLKVYHRQLWDSSNSIGIVCSVTHMDRLEDERECVCVCVGSRKNRDYYWAVVVVVAQWQVPRPVCGTICVCVSHKIFEYTHIVVDFRTNREREKKKTIKQDVKGKVHGKVVIKKRPLPIVVYFFYSSSSNNNKKQRWSGEKKFSLSLSLFHSLLPLLFFLSSSRAQILSSFVLCVCLWV